MEFPILKISKKLQVKIFIGILYNTKLVCRVPNLLSKVSVFQSG